MALFHSHNFGHSHLLLKITAAAAAAAVVGCEIPEVDATALPGNTRT
jgi:hypothetical protein